MLEKDDPVYYKRSLHNLLMAKENGLEVRLNYNPASFVFELSIVNDIGESVSIPLTTSKYCNFTPLLPFKLKDK